jgi:hypothetical protein
VTPRAFFRNVEDLAQFCAALAKAGVSFTVAETATAGCYEVAIEVQS